MINKLKYWITIELIESEGPLEDLPMERKIIECKSLKEAKQIYKKLLKN